MSPFIQRIVSFVYFLFVKALVERNLEVTTKENIGALHQENKTKKKRPRYKFKAIDFTGNFPGSHLQIKQLKIT